MGCCDSDRRRVRLTASYDGSGYAPIRSDAITDAIVTIEYEHHEIHGASSFTADADDTVMADTDTLVIAFRTPDSTERPHMLTAFSTLVGGYLEVWEGATWTTGTGVQLDVINRHRVAPLHSSTLLEDTSGAFLATDHLVENPGGLNVGAATLLHTHRAFGVTPRPSGDERRADHEFVLAPDTQYAVRFTAVGNNNAGQIILNWYEHTDVR